VKDERSVHASNLGTHDPSEGGNCPKIYYIKRFNTFQIKLLKEIFHYGFLNRTNSKLSQGVDHLKDEVVADDYQLSSLEVNFRQSRRFEEEKSV